MTRVYTDEGIFPRETFRRPSHDAHPRGVRRNEAQLEADFLAPVLATNTREIREMVRGGDPIESQRAAVDVLPTRTALQRRILEIIATEGAMTDRELELRAEFRGYGPSSVRKRRCEVYQAGKLRKAGRRDKLTLWEIAP